MRSGCRRCWPHHGGSGADGGLKSLADTEKRDEYLCLSGDGRGERSKQQVQCFIRNMGTVVWICSPSKGCRILFQARPRLLCVITGPSVAAQDEEEVADGASCKPSAGITPAGRLHQRQNGAKFLQHLLFARLPLGRKITPRPLNLPGRLPRTRSKAQADLIQVRFFSQIRRLDVCPQWF